MKKIVEKIWNMLNKIKANGGIYMKKLINKFWSIVGIIKVNGPIYTKKIINKFWSIIDKIGEDEYEPSKDDYVCVQINIYKI